MTPCAQRPRRDGGRARCGEERSPPHGRAREDQEAAAAGCALEAPLLLEVLELLEELEALEPDEESALLAEESEEELEELLEEVEVPEEAESVE